MDFGATMKGRTGGLESNGPEAGNRRKFLATAAAAEGLGIEDGIPDGTTLWLFPYCV
jgi:hypothetical protein